MGSKDPTRTDLPATGRLPGVTRDRPRRSDLRDRSRELPRRRLLATVGAVATGGIAGCSSVTRQSFEASRVALSADDRERLWLGETGRESPTVSRDGPVGTELEITNRTVVYGRGAGLDGDETPDRHGPLRTGLGRFVETVNGGRFGDGAAVVTASDAGVGELTLDFFEDAPTLPDPRWSLVVPAGSRTGGSVTTAETLALVPGTAVPADEWVLSSNRNASTSLVPGNEWFPGSQWVPGNEWFPGSQWVPGNEWLPDDPTSLQVLVVTGEASFEDLFGRSVEAMDGRRLEEGESISSEDTLLAIPGSRWVPTTNWVPGNEWEPADLFDASHPAPLGGATFGLAVLSTPDASVAGQSANPLVGMDTVDLLRRGETRRTLGMAGVTDADVVEWHAGPYPATVAGPSQTDFMGRETEVESFSGVVGGTDGAWGVGVHVARATTDDHVVAAGVTRTPVGSADEPPEALWPEDHLSRSVELTAEAVSRAETHSQWPE